MRLLPVLLALLCTAGCAGRPTVIPALPQPVDGSAITLETPAIGRVAMFASTPSAPTGHRPLLLIHSVNAAGSAYEVRPLFDHARATRPVYAIDLPGFGLSERSDRAYTPRLMTDAVLAAAAEIRRRHGDVAIDAAVNPAEGPWLFFMPINLSTGETVFSETFEQHQVAVQQLGEWCVAHRDEGGTRCD